MKRKEMHMVTFILVIVGAVNWGLVGLLGINFVSMLFSSIPMLEKLVYIAVGAAGVYEFVIHKETCKLCGDATNKKK